MTDDALKQSLAQVISDHLGQQVKLGHIFKGEDVFPTFVVLLPDSVIVLEERFDSFRVTNEAGYADIEDVEVHKHYSGWAFSAQIGSQTVRVEGLDKESADILAGELSRGAQKTSPAISAPKREERSLKPLGALHAEKQPRQKQSRPTSPSDHQAHQTTMGAAGRPQITKKKNVPVVISIAIAIAVIGAVVAVVIPKKRNVCDEAIEKYVDCLEAVCEEDPSHYSCDVIDELREMDTPECDGFFQEQAFEMIEKSCEELTGR